MSFTIKSTEVGSRTTYSTAVVLDEPISVVPRYGRPYQIEEVRFSCSVEYGETPSRADWRGVGHNVLKSGETGAAKRVDPWGLGVRGARAAIEEIKAEVVEMWRAGA